MSLKNDVVKGVKWSTISTVVIALVAVIKISILARLLDKSDFGLMALVTFVMGFMNLFNDMGLTSAIIHIQNISKKEYASLFWFNLMMSGIMYTVLLLVVPFISSFYNEPALKILIPLLGLNLFISALGKMFKTIEQKELKFKSVALFDIIAAFSSLILAIFLALKNYGVYALVYSALLQYSLMNLLYLILGLNKYGLLCHCKYKDTKPFLKIGVYQVGGQIINYFNRDLDILIIAKFFNSELLGGYSLAKQLVLRPMQVINPIITKVASPTLAKYQNDIIMLKKNFLKLISIVSSINIPIYLSLIITAPWIIRIFYGEGFEDIIILVRILSVYLLIRSISSTVGSLIVATGKTKLEFRWNLITLLVSPVCILFGSNFGLIGASCGILCSIFILYIPAWWFLIYPIIKCSLIEYTKACFIINYKFLFNIR